MPVQAQATGQAAVDEIRTETFRGREYTVVPVIGLVEGVLFGINAAAPEFAAADEFAKFPAGWNGRPVTMDHPTDDEGNLVSANSPSILEKFQMGFLANSYRDGQKLKYEAWIDNELVSEKGGDFQSTLDRLNSGETLVEVSTGLFTEIVPARGLFNGQSYSGAWTSVVPDHLAMLPEGTRGACSVADGCGAPRLNHRLAIHTSGSDGTAHTTVTTVEPLNLGRPPQHCCDACARGEDCMAGNNSTVASGSQEQQPATNATTGTPPEGETATNSTQENGNEHRVTEGATGRREPGTEEERQLAESGGRVEGEPSGTEAVSSQPVPEQVAQELLSNQRAAHALERLVTNSIDPSVTLDDARSVVRCALQDMLPYAYAMVLAMTAEQVVYMVIDWESDHDGETYAINYSVDADGAVTLTGEPVPVNLMTRIVPKPAEADDITGNAEASGANQQQEGTATMAGENQTQPAGGESQTPETQPENAGGEVSTNASGAEASSAPRTLEGFLADAPEDVREVLQEGITLRAQKRQKLVSAIVANSNGQYSEDMLKDQKRYPVDELERIAALCAPREDNGGRFIPNGRQPGINTNTQQEVTEVPRAPRAFERKQVQRGGTVSERLRERSEGQED